MSKRKELTKEQREKVNVTSKLWVEKNSAYNKEYKRMSRETLKLEKEMEDMDMSFYQGDY